MEIDFEKVSDWDEIAEQIRSLLVERQELKKEIAILHINLRYLNELKEETAILRKRIGGGNDH